MEGNGCFCRPIGGTLSCPVMNCRSISSDTFDSNNRCTLLIGLLVKVIIHDCTLLNLDSCANARKCGSFNGKILFNWVKRGITC